MTEHQRRVPAEVVVALLASVLWLALAWNGARRLGPVVDEPPHIAAGYAVARHGDYRMNPEHPMLFKVLAVLPMLALQPPDVPLTRDGRELSFWADGDQWRFGHFLLETGTRDPAGALAAARIVPILTGLAGGWLAFAWGRRLSGARAGLLAMLFLLFYPEYLGHARYVTLDVPTLVACAGLCHLALPAHAGGAARRASWCVFAAVLALVKLPVAIFAAVTAVVAGALLRPEGDSKGRMAARLAGTVAVLAVMGVVAQWAMAGFRFELTSPSTPALAVPNTYATPSPHPGGAVGWLTEFAAEHRLLPQAALATLNHTTAFEGRMQFLLGEWRRLGWWQYFAVTAGLKTPLPMLAGAVLGLAWLVRTWRAKEAGARTAALLVAPFAVLLALTVLSRVSIGHRHVLFAYFPVCVLMGCAGAELSARAGDGIHRAARMAPAALAAWLVILCIHWHPFQATYFNALAGGTELRGSLFLADSNIDWGEGLPETARELEARTGSRKCNLAAFGVGAPRAWGLGEFRFILPAYPHAHFVEPAQAPDPALPTLVSLNALFAVRQVYPGFYDQEPEHVLGPYVIFGPLGVPAEDVPSIEAVTQGIR